MYDFLFDLNRNYTCTSIFYRFRVIASYLSEVAYFNLPHLHLVPPLCGLVRISPRPLASKNWSPWAIVWRCFRDSIRLAVLTQYRRVTDGRTYDHNIYRACIASRGKNYRWWLGVVYFLQRSVKGEGLEISTPNFVDICSAGQALGMHRPRDQNFKRSKVKLTGYRMHCVGLQECKSTVSIMTDKIF